MLVSALCGCGHEALWLGPEPGPVTPVGHPAPLIVALRPGGFEASRLESEGVVRRFEAALRDARLFQAILFPVPPGVDPTWEIELSASDTASEPDSNFWKSALATLPPVAPFVKLESDYTLRLEALLVRNRVVVGSYVGEAPIRYRWGPYANRAMASLEGMELAVGGASRAILSAIAADLDRLAEVDRP